MIRKINRIVKDMLRPIRLGVGKLIWDKKKYRRKIEEGNIITRNSIQSVLFMRTDGKIGDTIITTLLFRELRKAYPHLKIGVVTNSAAREIIKENPYINEVYLYEKSFKSRLRLAERINLEEWDLLVDFSDVLKVHQMMFINLCSARFNMGLDKENWKLFTINMKSGVDFPLDAHITERYMAYLRRLGVENPTSEYDIFIPLDRCEKALAWYDSIILGNPLHKKIVVFNPYGASRYRSFNIENIKRILKLLTDLGYSVVPIYPSEKFMELEKICAEMNIKNIYLTDKLRTITDSATLIKYADLVISPDTSIVHIARAFNVDLIAVYREDLPGENNYKVWGPNYSGAHTIFAKSKSGHGETSDVNDFSIEELKALLDKID